MTGRLLSWVLGLVLAAAGLYLTIGGVTLLTAGGSVYYLAAGIASLASAILLVMGRKQAAYCYAGLLVVTLLWSIWEVGIDGWALAPRLIGPAVLGLCFLIPPIWRFAGSFRRWWIGAPLLGILLLYGVAIGSAYNSGPSLPPAPAIASHATDAQEWRAWGRTSGGDRFAPVSQITAGNVGQLEAAWTFTSDVAHMPLGYRFSATPLLVDNRLFACLERNVVVALDPETGRELWRADPHINAKGLQFTTCRGVAYADTAPSGVCAKRIIWGTADMRLMAVDAETGRACESFGTHGEVDLGIGLGSRKPGEAMVTSPPTVVNGVAIVGHFVSDGMPDPSIPGVVRGYDTITGALRWAWQGDRPNGTGAPAPGQNYEVNTPNAWTVFSADEAQNLVFIPTGNVPPDTYGARRTPGSEKYSSSLVALDVATGNVRWSFQTVHHDLWDYDGVTQAVAVDLPVGGGTVPALIFPTKRGDMFVLDRRTGKPIDPVVERPAPQGNLYGDRTAPTQPYTTGFPSLAGPKLQEADMWGLTPLDQLWCRIKFKQARYEGAFTPPSAPASIQYPGSPGGSSWGGISVDAVHGRVVANVLYMADYHTVVPPDKIDSVPRARASTKRLGTNFAIIRDQFLSPMLVPCQRPPYGRIAVFDLKTRALLWSHPLGTSVASGPYGMESHLPIPMGAPNVAGNGSITTAGGLIFTAAGNDRVFRAYDIGNGREVLSKALPGFGTGTPMSYLSRSGRQFVVVPVSQPGTRPKLIAYALPKRGG